MARTFTEAEAQRIFARIAEKQHAADTDAGGLSLDDLEEAARAAGLDPALVASAAAELDMPDTSRTLLGAPTEVVRQRLVRGAVSDETWEALVAAARAEFGEAGIAGQVGRVREWSVGGGGRRQQGSTTRLSLEPVGADTRVVLAQSVRQTAVGFTIAGAIQAVMAVVFAVSATATADASLWVPVAMMTAMAVLFLGGSQAGLRLWQSRQSRRSDAFLDRLDLLTRDAEPRGDASRDADHPAGRIDPTLLDAEALDADDSDTQTRTRA